MFVGSVGWEGGSGALSNPLHPKNLDVKKCYLRMLEISFPRTSILKFTGEDDPRTPLQGKAVDGPCMISNRLL